MSISKMIIYSSSLVAIIAGIAGYIAYESFLELEQSILAGEKWHAPLHHLQSTIVIACISIFFIALICGQYIARFLNRSISNLANLANGIDKNESEADQSSEKKLNSLASALKESGIITEQKEQLEQLNNELQLKNDSLDSLVYRVSHDLKAPIINIQSLIKVMKERVSPTTNPIIDQSLGMAEKATFKLQNTIVDLLEVARIEKRLKADKEWVSLLNVVSSILEDNLQQIIQSKTEFDIELDAANELYFCEHNLCSILGNLISNAIKYHSPDRDPIVKIHSQKQDNGLTLIVEDNGVGIDLKKHEGNLFQMFKRFHDHVEGSGVGLYIVKKLIEDNGGSIKLESEVNVGTKITLHFNQPANSQPILEKEKNIIDQA